MCVCDGLGKPDGTMQLDEQLDRRHPFDVDAVFHPPNTVRQTLSGHKELHKSNQWWELH